MARDGNLQPGLRRYLESREVALRELPCEESLQLDGSKDGGLEYAGV
jgi:hypothetical protein